MRSSFSPWSLLFRKERRPAGYPDGNRLPMGTEEKTITKTAVLLSEDQMWPDNDHRVPGDL